MSWPLLDSLTESERRDLLVVAQRRRFKRNEVIFHEGDPGDTLLLVAKGHIGVSIHTPFGDVATVRVLKPGEFFGELAVVSPGPRNATAVALDAVETLSLRREHFDELRAQHPDIDRLLTDALVAEVRRLAGRLVEATYLPVDKRVWRRIAELGSSFEPDVDELLRIPLTQELLAQLAGCTRPTLNRVLQRGEALGLIRLGRGWLEIADVEGVRKQAA